MATFQLFFLSGRAKELSTSVYYKDFTVYSVCFVVVVVVVVDVVAVVCHRRRRLRRRRLWPGHVGGGDNFSLSLSKISCIAFNRDDDLLQALVSRPRRSF